ncbi:hypothetical protein H4R99_006832 [Coemansia sp. RSA 1722]|nr:hypothetical protein IWW45_004895 [Coemansia sp. RSA 485]KAJ2591228.1 hypothetical protein H4R99_006832 [Coemansia sp. RSA 1722]
MVSLTNVASILVAVMAAGTQVANAVPNPQEAASDGNVEAVSSPVEGAAQGNIDVAASTSEAGDSQEPQQTPQAGEGCDVTVDRIVCGTDTSLLFCSNNEWVEFSNCTTGTVCKDGMCVFPDTEDDAQNEDSADQPQSSDPVTQEDDQDSAAAQDGDTNQDEVSSSDVADTAAEPADSQQTEGTEDAQASSSDDGGDQQEGDGGEDSGGGSTDSGDSFGITCDKFSEAVTKAGDAIGQKYPAPSDAQCQSFLKGMPEGDISSAREAAMFLSNILWESDGLQAKEEYACQDMPDWCAENYKTPEDVEGQTYWGRGYIQLSWHYNYVDASEGLYGDDRLAKDTSQVSKNEDTAWAVSFWFWKDRVRSDPGVQEGNFGASINKINGGLECNGGAAADKAKKRYEMYKVVLPIFAPGETPKESGCYN